MVCIPCIVIPFVLWFFHRYLRPILAKVFPSWISQQKIEEGKSADLSAGDIKPGENVSERPESEKVEQNGVANGVSNGVCSGQTVTTGGESKKDN